MVLMTAFLALAQVTNSPVASPSTTGTVDVQNLLNVLSPIIAIFVTWLISKWWSQVPKLYVPLIATALGTGVAYLGSLASHSGQSFWVSLGIGLATVTLREILKQITESLVALKSGKPVSRMNDL